MTKPKKKFLLPCSTCGEEQERAYKIETVTCYECRAERCRKNARRYLERLKKQSIGVIIGMTFFLGMFFPINLDTGYNHGMQADIVGRKK